MYQDEKREHPMSNELPETFCIEMIPEETVKKEDSA